MKFFFRSISGFLADNRGAVTVDYVVLTAAATGVAIASLNVVMDGLRTLAGNVNDESSGVDVASMDGTLTYSDGFDNGASGWEGAVATEVDGIGTVLGPIGGTGGVEDVTKSFTLDDGFEFSMITFDMYAMDSLDDESGYIFVGGQKVGELRKNGSETVFTAFDIPGITITGDIIEQNTQLGGRAGTSAWWQDSKAEITILYEKPDPNLTIGFGSNANQGTDDESFAIDDFTVTGLHDPDATVEQTSESEAEPGV